METTSITLITGGVRSGKSGFAEKYTEQLAQEQDTFLHYIATAARSDAEMAARISRHQQDRKKSKFAWQTWEQTTNIGTLATSFTKKDIVLLDCLTIWLTNELFFRPKPWNESCVDELLCHILTGIKQIGEACHTLVIVSNEVLSGASVYTELLYTYGKLLGKLHQHIVKMATNAYLVESGIPVEMKH